MKQIRVLSYRHDALGSRLAALANAWRVSKFYNLPLHFVWVGDDPRYGIEVSDIGSVLDAGFIREHRVPETRFANADGKAIALLEAFPGERIAVHTSVDGEIIIRMSEQSGRFKFQNLEKLVPALKERRTGDLAYAPSMQDALRAIPFTAAINAAVSAYNVDRSAVAVHIRRGDVVRDLRLHISGERRMNDSLEYGYLNLRYAPIALYASALREVDPANPILVFSDDKAGAARLRDFLPDRDISVVSIEGLSSVATAAAELLCMARTSKIFGTMSVYREAAAELGGIHTDDINRAVGKQDHEWALSVYDPQDNAIIAYRRSYAISRPIIMAIAANPKRGLSMALEASRTSPLDTMFKALVAVAAHCAGSPATKANYLARCDESSPSWLEAVKICDGVASNPKRAEVAARQLADNTKVHFNIFLLARVFGPTFPELSSSMTDRAIKSVTPTAMDLRTAGELAAAVGNREAEAEYFRKALALNPDHAMTRERLEKVAG